MTVPASAPALHPTPAPRAVLRAQLRVVLLALRWPAAAAAGLLAVTTVMVVAEWARGRGGIDFNPELSIIPGVVGLLLPIGVWRGEDRFGDGLLWTLPVDRRAHALARVAAGWAWLLLALAVFQAWLLALVLLTGGNVLGDQVVQVLASGTTLAPMGAVEPSQLRTVRLPAEPALWLVPFTAATGAYAIGSAYALGVRHPVRWLVGPLLALLLVSAVGAAAGSRALALAPSGVLETLMYGTYGFDTLLTARSESLHTVARLPSGAVAPVWLALPDLGHWVAATLLWTGGGLAALWLAASRHGERRRA
ncbi:hypothetical protein [Roseisolibacter sp. H3M3-2]|uniref:hypothetical protein n=1 Tax=Roseisolibacter sp. H3M3-2 TaxID=3031323 RepID=UPI0023D999C1|nr:hypothetical protein [Roseisolibacter sp. H3M3-2]MDF1504847.1 hypothetical protein [Roseisolibacter sp. H3M3-2]